MSHPFPAPQVLGVAALGARSAAALPRAARVRRTRLGALLLVVTLGVFLASAVTVFVAAVVAARARAASADFDRAKRRPARAAPPPYAAAKARARPGDTWV